VFITELVRRIQISIMTITTRTAVKGTSIRTIATGGKTTLVTALRTVAWVNRDDTAALRCGLVLQEALQLGEGPGMQAALGFAASRFDPLTDVREVFDHNRCTGLNRAHDRRG
jgi:hypothetical protein